MTHHLRHKKLPVTMGDWIVERLSDIQSDSALWINLIGIDSIVWHRSRKRDKTVTSNVFDYWVRSFGESTDYEPEERKWIGETQAAKIPERGIYDHIHVFFESTGTSLNVGVEILFTRKKRKLIGIDVVKRMIEGIGVRVV